MEKIGRKLLEQKEIRLPEAIDPEVRRRVLEEFFGEFAMSLGLVRGWNDGGVHIRGCVSTTYLNARCDEGCDAIQEFVGILTPEQVAMLPTSGSEYASGSASEY